MEVSGTSVSGALRPSNEKEVLAYALNPLPDDVTLLNGADVVSDATRKHETFYAKALTDNSQGWVKRTTQRIVYGTAPCAERWPEREYLY